MRTITEMIDLNIQWSNDLRHLDVRRFYCNDQALKLKDPAEIPKHSALEEYEDAEELGPPLKERTVMTLELAERLRLIEAHVKGVLGCWFERAASSNN